MADGGGVASTEREWEAVGIGLSRGGDAIICEQRSSGDIHLLQLTRTISASLVLPLQLRLFCHRWGN